MNTPPFHGQVWSSTLYFSLFHNHVFLGSTQLCFSTPVTDSKKVNEWVCWVDGPRPVLAIELTLLTWVATLSLGSMTYSLPFMVMSMVALNLFFSWRSTSKAISAWLPVLATLQKKMRLRNKTILSKGILQTCSIFFTTFWDFNYFLSLCGVLCKAFFCLKSCELLIKLVGCVTCWKREVWLSLSSTFHLH